MSDSEFRDLAENAERLADSAPTGGIAANWRKIAEGFRGLARLVGQAPRGAPRGEHREQPAKH